MTAVFRWIAFSADAAMDASDTCRRVAMDLRGQGWHRREVAGVALADFKGSYSTLLVTGCEIESADRARLTQALDTLADQIEQATAAARREENRLEQLHQNQKRLEKLALTSPELFTGPRFVDWGIPAVAPPSIDVSFEAGKRPRVATTHNSAGTVSAKPETLRQFASYVLGASAVMEGLLHEVEVAWNAFASSCSWLGVGACPVLPGARIFLGENQAEAQWVETIAAAFEHAGTSGELPELEVSIAVAGAHRRYAQQLLSDKTLTPDQLKAVVTALANDEDTAPVVAEYARAQLTHLSPEMDPGQLDRVITVVEGVSQSPYGSALLLDELKAEGLLGALGFAGPAQRIDFTKGQKLSEGLREVFRNGEPHLNLVTGNRNASRDYANGVADALEKGYDPVAASFLLRDSELSPSFLLTLGPKLEAIERKEGLGVDVWRNSGGNSGLTAYFSDDTKDIAFDVSASYFSALVKNPELTHSVLTRWNDDSREYWFKERQWGHDNFNSISTVLDVAAREGRRLEDKKTSRLVSTAVTHMANRGEVFHYNNDERILPGSLDRQSTRNFIRLFGTYGPSIESAITGKNINGDSVDGLDTVVWPDGTQLENMPRFNMADLGVFSRALTSTDEGAAGFRQMLNNYHEFRLEKTLADHKGTEGFDTALADTLRSEAQTEGFFGGQYAQQRIQAGMSQDQADRQWAELGLNVLDSVPFGSIPGIADKPFREGTLEFLSAQLGDEVFAQIESNFTMNQTSAEGETWMNSADRLKERKGMVLKELHEAGIVNHEQIIDAAVTQMDLEAQLNKANTQPETLTPAQKAVADLNPEQLKSLTPEQVAAFTPEQVAALESDQVKTLTPSQLQAMTPEQLEALRGEQIENLSTEQEKVLKRTFAEHWKDSNFPHTSTMRGPTDYDEGIDHLTKRHFNNSDYETTHDSYYQKYKDGLNAEGHTIDENREKALRTIDEDQGKKLHE